MGGGGGMITGANTGVLNVGGGSSGGYDYRCEHRRTEPGRGWELGGGGYDYRCEHWRTERVGVGVVGGV